MRESVEDDHAYGNDFIDRFVPGAFPSAVTDGHDHETSNPRSLSQAVFARRAEYTRPRTIRIKVGTWNVASFKGTEHDVRGWFVHGQGITEGLAGLTISHDPNGVDNTPVEGVKEQEARRTSKESTIPKNDPGSLPGGEEIGLYALGLQEVVDITSPAEALRPFTDHTVASRFKSAVGDALPDYKLVAEQQLLGLLLLVFAAPRVAEEIKSVSTASVGTGLMGYMGNKGAVSARLVLGETTRLVFINCHLAAGADRAALDRRIWDASQIVGRTRFDPIVDAMGLSQLEGETIGQEDFTFWFGDLNFRLDGLPGEDIRRLLTLHVRNEYGTQADEKPDSDLEDRESSHDSVISPSSSIASKEDNWSTTQTSTTLSDQTDRTSQEDEQLELDPSSLQATLLSLLPHDELQQQQAARKAFHEGWREGQINFLPTYKYDVGSVATFDSSEKKRCPSYCDRILYRTRKDKDRYEKRLEAEQKVRKEDTKPEDTGNSTTEDDVLFDYDPTADGTTNTTTTTNNDAPSSFDYDEFADPDNEPETVTTQAGFEDEIVLEHYVSHQRVLSSDHKPLEAVFSFKYDAVVPDLRARVQQEVARELDRAENEGRPNVILVLDDDHTSSDTRAGKGSDTKDAGQDQSFKGIDFGDVRFSGERRRNITAANNGRVPATIAFVDGPNNADEREQGRSAKMPSWLSVHFDREPDERKEGKGAVKGDVVFEQYTLQPGDACHIELVVLVEDVGLVRGFNSSELTLDDILVLRVTDGRDHFLHVHGHWMQTCLGRSVDELIRVPEGGIRAYLSQDAARTTDNDAESHAVKWSAPRELFRLIESIENRLARAMAEWEMTRGDDDTTSPWHANAGWPFAPASWTAINDDALRRGLLSGVVDALDTDSDLNSTGEMETSTAIQRLEILCECLLLFLSSLSDGIVTSATWSTIEEGLTAHEKSKLPITPDEKRTWLLETLSATPNHNVPFVLLTSMLVRAEKEIIEGGHSVSSSTRSRAESTSGSGEADIPSSPQTKIRRKTLSHDPTVARRQIIEKTYAKTFAAAVIHAPGLPSGKEKDRQIREEKMAGVLELFLNEAWEL